MKEEITSQSFREKEREKSEQLSLIIDRYYEAFFEVAKRGSELKMEATRILTPYGDFTIVFKKLAE